MKIILPILLLCFSISTHAQQLSFEQLATIKTTSTSEFLSYKSKNGEVFQVEQKIKIGHPSNGIFFSYIQQGDLVVSSLTPAPAMASGQEVEIKRIEVWGNKKLGHFASVRTKGGVAGYYISIENAIETGEVVTSVMTSDQALAELKKAKDKLDLGLITQVAYDSIKIELAKIIK